MTETVMPTVTGIVLTVIAGWFIYLGEYYFAAYCLTCVLLMACFVKYMEVKYVNQY